jgi:hypothetical protein
VSDISDRITKAIEKNFDDCVAEAAHAEWMRLSGKFDQPADFQNHLKIIIEMRTRQLAAAEMLGGAA